MGKVIVVDFLARAPVDLVPWCGCGHQRKSHVEKRGCCVKDCICKYYFVEPSIPSPVIRRAKKV